MMTRTVLFVGPEKWRTELGQRTSYPSGERTFKKPGGNGHDVNMVDVEETESVLEAQRIVRRRRVGNLPYLVVVYAGIAGAAEFAQSITRLLTEEGSTLDRVILFVDNPAAASWEFGQAEVVSDFDGYVVKLHDTLLNALNHEEPHRHNM